ncbi:hypothetical protein ACQI5H_24480 [Mycobacterium heidelbergense]|uniref:hypothetical protein n=1 Tax=Mycobacterium heidelbergense TaxID=53376 RepID=UPI003CF4A7B5
MSVAGFVAGVDRVLTRAHQLYPAGGASAELPASTPGSVPGSPEGSSGLQTGVVGAAGSYQQTQTTVAGLDEQLQQTAAQGSVIGQQGRAASGLIRDQARTTAAALMPMSRSPAGAQLLMAAMDQHLSAMQGQLQTTKAQYQGVTAALRQTAADYRGIAGTPSDGDGIPSSPDDQTVDDPRTRKPHILPVDHGDGGPQPPNPAVPPTPGAPQAAPPTSPGLTPGTGPHSEPLPVPKPLHDFTQYQLHGQPIPNPPAPNVTADQLRQQIINQRFEFREYVQWFNKTYGGNVTPEELAAQVTGMQSTAVGTLASLAGLPATAPVTVSGVLGLLAQGWLLSTKELPQAQIPDLGPP